MKKVILIIVVALLAIVFFKAARHRTAPAGAVSAAGHSLAPDFSLTDLKGQPLDLSSYREKVVLLDFWATWCAPCRAEIPHFVEFQNNYRDQGFQVIGISMDDDLKPVGPFYNEYKMNYPVALGNDKLAQSYGGILGLPVTFLIGRDGHIQAKYVGAVDVASIEQAIRAQLAAK